MGGDSGVLFDINDFSIFCMKKVLIKWASAFAGGISAIFLPIVPLVLVAFLFVLADVITAWRLNRRVIEQKRTEGVKICKDQGKFFSKKSSKVFGTMIEVFAVILLAHLLDVTVLSHLTNLHLANYVAGVICMVQGWSILENCSSSNGASWARLLQKVMVDKTKRHFNIDLIKDNEDE